MRAGRTAPASAVTTLPALPIAAPALPRSPGAPGAPDRGAAACPAALSALSLPIVTALPSVNRTKPVVTTRSPRLHADRDHGLILVLLAAP